MDLAACTHPCPVKAAGRRCGEDSLKGLLSRSIRLSLVVCEAGRRILMMEAVTDGRRGEEEGG